MSTSILNRWRQLTEHLGGQAAIEQYAGDEPPLRSELFSADQMEQHGKTLAGGTS